ncbi:MAG: transposase [Deltaproteobacteria bacterium]|nr:transposase [Deltaproteobacteria bacterium]
MNVQEYESVQELVEGLKAHFDFYNNERTHQGLGSKTPARSIGMNYK